MARTHPNNTRAIRGAGEGHGPMTVLLADGRVMEVPMGNAGCETLECVLRCSEGAYADNIAYCEDTLAHPRLSMYTNGFGNVVSPVVPRDK